MSECFQQEMLCATYEMGAKDAKIFLLSDIAFDTRTLLKCLYGCPGGVHYCPSSKDIQAALALHDIVKQYRWGVILCTDDLKKGQEITLSLESKAFLAGYYFAFGTTECVSCELCSAIEGKPCVNKRKQRPPLYALGIDVYKTVRGLGWELNVVQKQGDPAKNITAVFVE